MNLEHDWNGEKNGILGVVAVAMALCLLWLSMFGIASMFVKEPPAPVVSHRPYKDYTFATGPMAGMMRVDSADHRYRLAATLPLDEADWLMICWYMDGESEGCHNSVPEPDIF